jgi:hypothetical protein
LTPAAASCASAERRPGDAADAVPDAFQVSDAHPPNVAASALAVSKIFAPGTRVGRLGTDDLAIMHLVYGSVGASNDVEGAPV